MYITIDRSASKVRSLLSWIILDISVTEKKNKCVLFCNVFQKISMRRNVLTARLICNAIHWQIDAWKVCTTASTVQLGYIWFYFQFFIAENRFVNMYVLYRFHEHILQIIPQICKLHKTLWSTQNIYYSRAWSWRMISEIFIYLFKHIFSRLKKCFSLNNFHTFCTYAAIWNAIRTNAAT